ncbi:hypothetical protein ANOM_008131 [Aspergillus nomiae NRRL 13137]|uniref:Rhodopsin domain-containing protein n=1 Tax=Aspergillus nomiae NRRL (strain ATCC 15546 / NRRL 13137 / CBS 260.88 / M93) TaxID=1509407 RepID=A0A0L1IWG8_ASPN3|nr:uncharacterized protein ANOM_008131 [Aspergillus nomiae NRRL 13137]KNG83906.1 hypothetical protein ANOM_008131 [Aspergillus nomiae NRRL 13137]
MPTTTGNTRDVVADESHLGIIIGVQTALTVLAVVVVCLRLYVRMKIVRSSGCDDWTMALAALCSLGGWALYIYKACHGLGHHIQFLDKMDRMKLSEAAFWQVIICSATGIALLKISIALNLLRFSPTRWYTMSLWTSIAFVAAYSFMAAMTFFLHCKPMQAHWDTRIEDAKCYPVHLFVIFALINTLTAFNIFTDVLFATIPIPIVWNLRMKRRVRMYLIGVFSLGYFTVGLGVIKAVAQLAYTNEKDIFFNDSILFWGLAQFNVGILTACVPSLKPLARRALKLSEYTHSRSRSHGRYGRRSTGRWTSSRHSRRVFSIHRRDQYGIEELHSHDVSTHSQSDEVKLTPYGATVSFTAHVERGRLDNSSEIDEDMLAETSPERRMVGGILKTTQTTVVSSRAAD